MFYYLCEGIMEKQLKHAFNSVPSLEREEKDYLIETINHLQNKPEGEKIINTLNVLANLLNENYNTPTKAKYRRQFKHQKLEITIDFDGLRT
jgi:hypothetical protein